IERWAVGTKAVIASRRDPGPHRVRVAELRELCDVTTFGGICPSPDTAQCSRDFAPQATGDRLLFREFESMQAKIVRAPLQQCDARRSPDRRGDRRLIAMEQLILQIARAGR